MGKINTINRLLRYLKGELSAEEAREIEKWADESKENEKELVALAKEKGLMLVDATPTAYMPNLAIIQEQLPKLGRIRLVMSNYSQYSSRYDLLLNGQLHNTFNPEFAGGCLMDLNYYNLYMNILLFGKPRNAVYYPNLWKNGIDTSGVLVMQYDDFISTNAAAKDASGENFFQIEGEKGYMYILGNNFMKNIRVVTKDGEENFNIQDNPNVWFYEIQKVTQLLREEDRITLSQGLDIMQSTMEVLENVRLGAGIRFPSDT
jgi:predicted dehydrogenase